MRVKTRERCELDRLEARAMLANTLSYADADGDQVTVKLTGPGTAGVTLSGGNLGPMQGLTLTGTTKASKLTISVKKAVAGDGASSLVNGNIGSAVDLGSLSAPAIDLTDTTLTFSNITRFVVRDVTGSEIVLATPAGGSLTITGRDWSDTDVTVTGNVSSMLLRSSDEQVDVGISGRLGRLTTPLLNGDWEASSYGGVTSLDTFRGRLLATQPTATGEAFGTLTFDRVLDGVIGPALGATAGRINKLSAGSWDSDGGNGGRIRATGVNTLNVTGYFGPDLLDLSAGPAAFSIRSGRIGTLDATIYLGSPVGTLKIGTAFQDAEIQSQTENVRVRSLTFFGDGQVRGTYRLTTVGTLVTGTGVVSQWTFTGKDSAGYAVRKMRMNSMLGAAVRTADDAGIQSLSTTRMDGVNLHTGFVGTMVIGPSTESEPSIDTCIIELMGQDSKGLALKSLSVVHSIYNSLLNTSVGNVGTIKAGRIAHSGIYVGHDLAVQQNFDLPDGFLTTASLGSLTITRPADLSDPALTNSVIRAAVMGKVAINGPVEISNLDIPFGLGVRSLASLTLQDNTGHAFKPAVPTTPGDFNPFAPLDSDFLVRVFA